MSLDEQEKYGLSAFGTKTPWVERVRRLEKTYTAVIPAILGIQRVPLGTRCAGRVAPVALRPLPQGGGSAW